MRSIRPVTQYFGWFDGTIDYAEANSVSDDTILLEVDKSYDAANNVTQTTIRLRYHNGGIGDILDSFSVFSILRPVREIIVRSQELPCRVWR